MGERSPSTIQDTYKMTCHVHLEAREACGELSPHDILQWTVDMAPFASIYLHGREHLLSDLRAEDFRQLSAYFERHAQDLTRYADLLEETFGE